MLHSTLPATRPSQRRCRQLLGKAMKPMAVMTHLVREEKWPHLALTLAVLQMELHTDPSMLSAQASRRALPFSVSLCHSCSSTHRDGGLVALMVWLCLPQGTQMLSSRDKRCKLKKVAYIPLDCTQLTLSLFSAYQLHL